MSLSFRSRVAGLGIVLAGGAVISLTAFSLTSITPTYLYLGPVCAANDVHPGFDPWTGEAHGRNYTYDCLGSEAWEPANPIDFVGDVPPELVGRREIPVPLGFLAGTAISFGLLVVVDRRSRLAWAARS